LIGRRPNGDWDEMFRDNKGKAMSEEGPHLTKTEARAGATPHMTRVILAVSLILVIGIFAILLFFWGN